MVPPDRRRSIDLALTSLERQFGGAAVRRPGDRAAASGAVVSSGCLSLDAALGAGGFPRGRVTEIFGRESCGKTTLALHAIAEAQKAGGLAAFLDAEHALDPAYAGRLGVDVDNLLVAQPDYGEQALEIAAALVVSGCLDIVVIDSVAALVPKIELEGEMGDSIMGLHARLMSQALRKLAAAVARTATCLIFINQIRQKIGVMFGNPETTTGGPALKFYTSVRAEVRQVGPIRDGETAIGDRTRVRVAKNTIAAPFHEAEFDILYGEGISREGDLLDAGVRHGLVEKTGSWFSYNGERLGPGREAARRLLKQHPPRAAQLERALRAALGLAKK